MNSVEVSCLGSSIFIHYTFNIADKTLVKVVIQATEASGSDIIGTVTISVLSMTGVFVVFSDFGVLLWQFRNIAMPNIGLR